MSKIVIAGGTGFLGGHLVEFLGSRGHEVVVLSRSDASVPGARVVRWDGKSVGDWAKELESTKAVINLAGAPIDKKWTESYKKLLRSSRVEPTMAIGQAIGDCENPPEVWVNFSAVGVYGDRGDHSLSESSRAGTGFMADLGTDWEAACLKFDLPRTRQVLPRLGVVLGKDGGAFPLLKSLTEKFLGSAVGSGRQFMSWIHIEDVCGLLDLVLREPLVGPVNFVAPNPVENREFMRVLREVLDKPSLPPVPGFMMKAVGGVIGIEGTVLLEGQRVFPVVAQGWGYEYQYPQLSSAVKALLSK